MYHLITEMAKCVSSLLCIRQVIGRVLQQCESSTKVTASARRRSSTLRRTPRQRLASFSYWCISWTNCVICCSSNDNYRLSTKSTLCFQTSSRTTASPRPFQPSPSKSFSNPIDSYEVHFDCITSRIGQYY